MWGEEGLLIIPDFLHKGSTALLVLIHLFLHLVYSFYHYVECLFFVSLVISIFDWWSLIKRKLLVFVYLSYITISDFFLLILVVLYWTLPELSAHSIIWKQKNFSSFPILTPMISFTYYLISMARTAKTMFNNTDKSGKWL